MPSTDIWSAYETYYRRVLKEHHNNPTLISLWGENLRDLETQILCHSNGVPVPDSNLYEDEETREVWGPARWPSYAYTDQPTYHNPAITYIIERRLKAIGTTWWDWKRQRTLRLGFDFDSLVGHAQGVGVSDETLQRISEVDIPWVEIIKSTRGLGRHLYIVFKEPYPVTVSHNEHAALARAYLPILSELTGLDLEASNDVCGGVMWIHHTNATKDNQGYALVKAATEAQTAEDVPSNWRDNVDVVSGSRAKVRVRGYTDDGSQTDGDEIDEMSKAHAKIKLDEKHKEIMLRIESSGFSTYWVADHHLLQTHTKALKQVYDEYAAEGNPLRGLFDTSAPGSDTGKPNCFLRPRTHGGWDVYRFGDTSEHPYWWKSGAYIRTTFNVDPTFSQIMVAAGGTENPDSKLGYAFNSPASVKAAISLLGLKLTLPPRCDDSRVFSIRQRPGDNKLILTVSRERSDKGADFDGFVKTPKGWERLLTDTVPLDTVTQMEETWGELDSVVRCLKQVGFDLDSSTGGYFDGWVLRDHTARWVSHPRENLTPFLKSQGYQNIDILLGKAMFQSWELVYEPFKPEYPGGRKWNRDAPQFRHQQADLTLDDRPHHPYWDLFLNHLGNDLNEYITELDWPKEWGIKCGGDYLKAWIACMLRFPFDKTPYLFFYGPQGTGKTMFKEVIEEILITKGVVEADRALTNEQGYNGELLNCILAVVDEVNISSKGAAVYNRLKNWSTGLTISIHAKYQQVFTARNSAHFVQMANEIEACPVFPGDKRITAVYVSPVVEEIPKDFFKAQLENEAEHFMYTLMNWDIPDAQSRLRLPIIETESKASAMAHTASSLLRFITNCCYKIDGAKIKFQEFYDAFFSSLDSELDRSKYTKEAVRNELMGMRDILPMGYAGKNQMYIGNLTMNIKTEPSEKYVHGPSKRLVRESGAVDNED